MAVSEARKRATKKYVATHYDEVRFRVKKGKKAMIEARAKQLDLSLAAYLNKLVDVDLAQAEG